MTCYQVFYASFKLNIPSDNAWYRISYHISLSHLSLCLFLPATDSDDGEADRINRSQSAPDEDEHGPSLAFLTVCFKVKSGNPSYLVSLLILSLSLSLCRTPSALLMLRSVFFCASAKWRCRDSQWHEMLRGYVFYVLDLSLIMLNATRKQHLLFMAVCEVCQKSNHDRDYYILCSGKNKKNKSHMTTFFLLLSWIMMSNSLFYGLRELHHPSAFFFKIASTKLEKFICLIEVKQGHMF